MTFLPKQIHIVFQLGGKQGGTAQNFAGTQSDSVLLTNYRITANISKIGSNGYSSAEVRIYGLDISLMNQLSTYGQMYRVTQNEIAISAGDSQSGLALLFQGTIQQAWVDFTGMPDVAFVVVAYTGLAAAMKPVPPASYSGVADASVVIGNIAKQAGYTFESNGVSVQLANPYYPGTARQQMEECARAANVNLTIDKGVVAIWPKGGNRGGTVPLISPQTGMIGYPTYTTYGIMIRTLYAPGFDVIGGNIQVQSSQQPACGTWNVFTAEYVLESQTPDGEWHVDMQCIQPGRGPYLGS